MSNSLEKKDYFEAMILYEPSKMFFRYATTRIFFLLFAMFVIAPLTLMVWRGIWGLLDEYITTINDEVNITSATYHPSTGCHFNTSEEPNLKNTQNKDLHVRLNEVDFQGQK